MAECQWVVGVRGSVLLPTGLAGFGTDCYVTITTQPFLPAGLICRSSLLSSACTFVPFSFVSVNVFILLPLSITAPCIIEYDSELLRTVLHAPVYSTSTTDIGRRNITLLALGYSMGVQINTA